MNSLSCHLRASSVSYLLRTYGGASRFSSQSNGLSGLNKEEIQRVLKIINDHPFPDHPLQPILAKHVPLASLSPYLVSNVLGRLFAAHSNGLKALEFYKYTFKSPNFAPSSDSFEKTLHILARMRYFDQAWALMAEIRDSHPHLLTLKSMSILLSKVAKFGSYEETLEAFARMETEIFKRTFETEEFNVLLRAFCTEREMKEARSIFLKMRSRCDPDVKTMNILLLGFKNSGDITAMELFYHEMLKRGFKPNSLTYGIRIDGFCKRRSFGDALRLSEEMERGNCALPLQILTTLIHGAGVARNKIKARQLFDEIPRRGLNPDTGAYNALISSLIKCRDMNGAIDVMNEMEEKGLDLDNVTCHTVLVGMKKSRDFGFNSICDLYRRMKEKDLVPNTRTMVMLMKLFCQNGNVDLALDLWRYMLKKGYCPHNHALCLLVTALCARKKVEEAFECSRQTLERGRSISEPVYWMLERHLSRHREFRKLEELKGMVKRLRNVLPPRVSVANSDVLITSL